jgi:peptidoglycan/xylan/chitin deacetylase (PgdA/CDA1 family)
VRRWRWLWLGPLLVAVALAGCGTSDGGDGEGRSAASNPARPKPRTDPAAVLSRASVPVLTYHQIRPQTAADSAADRAYIVAPGIFAEQMRALARAGYTTVSGDALVAHVARGAPLPRKPVLVTLDDGTAGQVSSALPILRRLQMRATFFVMTVVLGKPGWLSRGQVRMLDREGMTIGAHTWDHQEVPGYGPADWRKQIDAPTRELAGIVGHPIRLFAYPFGLWSSAAFPHLQEAGFTAAFQLADKLDPQHPLWTLRRIIVPQLSGGQLLREIKQDF